MFLRGPPCGPPTPATDLPHGPIVGSKTQVGGRQILGESFHRLPPSFFFKLPTMGIGIAIDRTFQREYQRSEITTNRHTETCEKAEFLLDANNATTAIPPLPISSPQHSWGLFISLFSKFSFLKMRAFRIDAEEGKY